LKRAINAANAGVMVRKTISSSPKAITSIASVFVILAGAESANAATYQIGPNKPFQQISQVSSSLQPGDVVEIEGNATYSSGSFSKNGTEQAKITIRGILRNGKRPVIKGGTNTIAVHGSHYVFENLEMTGGSSRCFFHHADDVTMKNSVVHDCPAQGILGADTGSGSLTLDQVEVYRCGEGTRKHQIYVATDEEMYPEAVFRMQSCYVHDGNGGNNVKSRAGRNEIYFNWVEGAMYHELELIGSEEFPEGLLREDSDVVGNVLRKTRGSFVVRFGGDGSGETNGRYRFVNNTVIMNNTTKGVFRLFEGLESVEMHNNVFSGGSGGSWNLIRDTEAKWAKGQPILGGSNNWVPNGKTTPTQWTGTIKGSDPGFVNVSAHDFTPASGSVLRNAGNGSAMSPAQAPFPDPLTSLAYLPPARKIEIPKMRPNDGHIDIGAIEAPGMPSTKKPPMTKYAEEGDNGEVQSMETALQDAGTSWDSMTCAMGGKSSRNASFPSILAGIAAMWIWRRRTSKRI
jgi:hypothetical protein